MIPDIQEEVSELTWGHLTTIVFVHKLGQDKLDVVHSYLVFDVYLRVVSDNEVLQIKRCLLGVQLPRFDRHKISPKHQAIFGIPQMFHCMFVNILQGDVLSSNRSCVSELNLG